MTDLTITQKLNLTLDASDRTLFETTDVPNGFNSKGEQKFKTLTWMIEGIYTLNKFAGLRVSVIEGKASNSKITEIFHLLPSREFGLSYKRIKRFNDDAVKDVIAKILTPAFSLKAVQNFVFPAQFAMCSFVFAASNHLVGNELDELSKLERVDSETWKDAQLWVTSNVPHLLNAGNANVVSTTATQQEVIDVRSTTVKPTQLIAEDTGVGTIGSVELKDYNSMNRTQLQEYCTELSIEFTQRHTAKELKELIAAKLNPVVETVTINA